MEEIDTIISRTILIIKQLNPYLKLFSQNQTNTNQANPANPRPAWLPQQVLPYTERREKGDSCESRQRRAKAGAPHNRFVRPKQHSAKAR